MNKYILPLLITAAIIFFSFAVYQYSKDNSSPSPNSDVVNNLDDNLKNSDNGTNIFNHSETSRKGKKSNTMDESKNRDSAGGGTDAGTENSGLPNQNPENKIKLPSDINTNACGFYYKDYQVCAGVCDEGKCISENRSCYCKKID